MDNHHAILARRPLHFQQRQDHGFGDGRGHDSCKGKNCIPTLTSTPKATSPATTAQPVHTTTTTPVAQTPVPSTTKQQTTSVNVATSHAASSTTSNASLLVTFPTANTKSSVDSTPTGTGSSDVNQNSDITASYSVYQYVTTDSNGYTIDVTSTSFFPPDATSTLNANADSGTTSSGSASDNVGPIVGGAVGAISFILLVLFAMWFIRHRRKNRTAPSAEFLSSSKYPFTGSSEFRFRQLSDSVDAQSISEYPFEPPRQEPPRQEPPRQERTDSPKSFLHMREKSETQ